MNVQAMLDRQDQLSVIFFIEVEQVTSAIKRIKNKMRMRSFLIEKRYQILYNNFKTLLEKVILVREAAIDRCS